MTDHTSMRAACVDRYGPAEGVVIRPVRRPEPQADEILVRVHATSVTTADWRMRAGAFPRGFAIPGRLVLGLRGPRRRVLGGDFAGRVEATGRSVTRFSPGDDVFGFSLFGAHAEFVVLKESAAVARKPADLSDAEAAALPFGALNALVFLRDVARIAPGARVLVQGASGGVGVHAVQLARHFGATVTAICSAGNLDLVRSLGAARAIDYVRERVPPEGERFDVILDVTGNLEFRRCRAAAAPRGIFLPLEYGLREIAQSLACRIARGPRIVTAMARDRAADLDFVAGPVEQGALRPVIEACLPFDSIAEAHRHAESRHKRGSIVVTIAPNVAAHRDQP
jgi:NADPH:quinone reductase-like Zn-dependent oxidoreductase